MEVNCFAIPLAREDFASEILCSNKEIYTVAENKLEYEGYVGTVNYDKKCDYYTGEVVIDGRTYTYEGETLEELWEDFEDIIDSMIAFDEMGDDEDDEEE